MVPPPSLSLPNEPRDTAAATAKVMVCLPGQLWLTMRCISSATSCSLPILDCSPWTPPPRSDSLLDHQRDEGDQRAMMIANDDADQKFTFTGIF